MIIPDGAAQVNLKFTGSGVPSGAEVTFGVLLGDPGNDPEAGATLTTGNVTATHTRANRSEEVAITAVLVKVGTNSAGPATEKSVSHGASISGDSTSPNV